MWSRVEWFWNEMFCTLNVFLFFLLSFFCPRGRFPSLPWDFCTLFTMILQRIRIIVGDAGFEPGTSASEVWCTSNEPPHLLNEPPHLLMSHHISFFFFTLNVVQNCCQTKISKFQILMWLFNLSQDLRKNVVCYPKLTEGNRYLPVPVFLDFFFKYTVPVPDR